MSAIHGTRIARILLLVSFLGILAGLISRPVVWAQESEADVVTAQAILAYDDKKYDEAFALLKQALKVSPNHTEALYYTGLVMMAQRRYEESLPYLTKAMETAPDSISVVFQLGVAYFSLGQYDKADPLLTRVFEERPTTNNVGYYVGYIRYVQQRYQEALATFKAGASTDERILQLTKFYSGLTLASLGLPKQAADEFREAMRLRTVSPLTGPADRLRDTLVGSQNDVERFHGQARVGGFFDSNVAVVPRSTGNPDVDRDRDVNSNTAGALTSLYLNYAWLLEDSIESTISYSFYQALNNHHSRFNIVNHFVSLGWFYREVIQSMPFQSGVDFGFDTTSLGGDQFLNRYSLSLFASLVENQHHLTTMNSSVQIKDFESGDLGNDTSSGTNWMLGFSHIIRFEGDKHLIRGGFQFDTDATLGRNFDYSGYRLQAGAVSTLPWKDVRIRYDYDVHFRLYDHPNTTRLRNGSFLAIGESPDVTQRVTEQNHVFRVEKLFPHNITLALDWQLTFSRSNIAGIFDYDRQVVTWGVAWAF